MSGKFHMTVTERLRAAHCNSAHPLMCEAADEIDRLSSKLRRIAELVGAVYSDSSPALQEIERLATGPGDLNG